ncbi:MAG: hypothetical protein J6B01_07180 [Ruminococcus sp.]|nr:hypothetical protein [Ruminococcus sp.]
MNNKSIIIFGAGTTAFCSMPTTEKQGKLFSKLFFNSDDEIKAYIKKEIKILTDKDVDELISFVKSKNAGELKDFIVDSFSENSFNMQDFYNFVDMAISEQRGFMTSCKIYTIEEIKSFRRQFLTLLQILFSIIENNILCIKQENFNKLKQFFKDIAEKELDKKISKLHNEHINMQSSDFILTDTEYISFNWDVLILWAILLAHKELNNDNSYFASDEYGKVKLKVFNEFFAFLDSCDISKNNGNWYPYNRTVAFRLNDAEYPSNKRVILFPTYFPHGQTHWLECPVCGKLTMFIDKDFRHYSEHFAMSIKNTYKCSHCENKLSLENSAMLLQTNYKIKAPYIEEIQRSMRVSINNAQKLIFIGYSLPSDDIEYKSIFRIGNRNNKKVYVVLYHHDSPNEFLSAAEAMSICKNTNTDTESSIKRFCEIFGDNNVKINLAGFPVASDKIIEIL